MTAYFFFWTMFFWSVLRQHAVQACGVCYTSVLHIPNKGIASSGTAFAAFTHFVQKRPLIFAGLVVMNRIVESHGNHLARHGRHQENQRYHADQSRFDESDNQEGTESEKSKTVAPKESEGMSTVMIASIGFYKQFISPLLPPACRFLPTCSQYGVQAIEEFGPTKGAILTTWRILRCSPLGGKGYDPPRWPPVHFTYSSY